MLPLMVVLHAFENKYFEKYQTPMDEMKQHRLLYFAQKEAYAEFDAPLFNEDFYGWRYGPVLHEVREYCSRPSSKPDAISQNDVLLSDGEHDFTQLLESVFNEYSSISSWTLSLLTHDEYSWKQSRKGLGEWEHGDKVMNKADIRRDALLLRLQKRNRLNQTQWIETLPAPRKI